MFFDKIGMKAAYRAAQKSPDPSSQNGAVFLSKENFVRVGWNEIHEAFWIHENEADNYVDRDFKLRYVTHAEQAAIFAAARVGVPTMGGTLICPWAACVTCARFIVESGIRRLVVHKQRMNCSSVWDDEIKRAFEILRKDEVEVCWLDAVFNDDSLAIRVSGKLWTP